MAYLILVVEDEAFLSSMYQLKLSKAGYEIKLAKNGDEALAAMEERTPDLIVLDLVMPITDGFKFLESIRVQAQWQTTPVLVISNLGQDEDKEHAKKLGVVDYLVKSNVTLEHIIERIQQILPTKPNA